MGSLAEWERAVSRERQMAGIAIAKENGVYKGRKPSLNEAEKKELNALALAGTKKTAIAKHFGISRQTLYSYLNNYTHH